MANIKICRICLALDVKVFKLGNTEAKNFIENIFKQNGYKQDLQETQYICFECKALLDKSYNFISRVLKAQDILFHMVKKNKIITPISFKQIDRRIIGLNLVKDFKYIDVFISEDENKIKKENESNELQEVECKVEVDDFNIPDPLENPIDDYDKKDIEIDFGLNLKVDHNSTDIDTKIGIKFPNYKFNNAEFEEEVDYTSLDDFDNTIQYEFNDTVLVERVKEEIVDDSDNRIENRKRQYLSRISKSGKPKKSCAKNKAVNKVELTTSKRAKTKTCRKNNDGNETKKCKAKIESNKQCGKLKYSGVYSELYDGRVDISRQIQQPETPKYPAKCDHCTYEVPNRTAHFHHYLLEHKDKKYPYAKQTGKQFVCQFCGLVNNKKSRHIDHELTHGTVNNFTCSRCPKSFANKHRLQKHTYRSHPLQMLECDYCGKKVKSRESLMIHIRMHTGERPFKCPFCGAGFAHRGNIRPHIRANHEQFLEQSDSAMKTNKRKTKYEKTDIQIIATENARLCASEMFMHLSNVMTVNHLQMN